MQITTQTFNWIEAEKRSTPEQILEEMIHTDDIDIYATDLPQEIWMSDSATQHFDTAEKIANEIKKNPSNKALGEVAALIAYGDSIDELGLSPLTEGVYFISISPERIAKLIPAFEEYLQHSTLDACCKQWITQWRDALQYANSKGLGIIATCG